MPIHEFAIPLLRAAAWFAEDPLDPALGEGADGFLDVAWGQPDVAFVEPMQRRRLSALARGFFHCAQRVAPEGDLRMVFASRHGESDRTLAILRELAAQADVSPTLFSMAVHNAVPGLWSILKGNRAPATAVAAGPESFGWGLVEAFGTFQADPTSPVLFVFAEEPLPALWAGEAAQPPPHAVALLIGAPAERTLTVRWAAGSPEPEAGAAQAFQALAALRGSAAREGRDGTGGAWHWQMG